MSLCKVSPGQFKLHGAVTFTTSHGVEQQGRNLLLTASTAHWHIDLASITEADSSALAVCLAWVRLARENRKKLTFTAATDELAALAQVCGVGELLGISPIQEIVKSGNNAVTHAEPGSYP